MAKRMDSSLNWMSGWSAKLKPSDQAPMSRWVEAMFYQELHLYNGSTKEGFKASRLRCHDREARMTAKNLDKHWMSRECPCCL